MPSVRSKLAPHFSGEIEQPVEDFLEEYELLADKHGLTEREMVETVIRYVDRSQRHIWKSLPGYVDRRWTTLCRQLRKQYVSPTEEGQYSKQKLLDFAKRYSRKCMEDETDVINYQRQFDTHSRSLLDSGRITVGERNAIFWRGFHPDDQQSLHERLIAKKPDKPKGKAFDFDDVFDTARAIFSGDDDFFLQDLPPRRHESSRARKTDRDGRASKRGRPREPSTSEDQDSDDDYETAQSDQEQRSSRGQRRSSPRVETKTVRFQDRRRKNEDLEDMIGRLHDLSVRDREYAILYAKCAEAFPNTMMGIPKPGYRDGTSTAAYSYSATTTPPPPLQNWSAQTAAPAPVPAASPANPNGISSFFRPRTDACAFCRAQGHRVRSCPIANEYLQSGRATVVEDRIHLPNGQPVPFDASRRGIKANIDAWLAAQSAAAPTQAQAHAVFTPRYDSRNASTSRIEEVIESHIIQVREATTTAESEDEFSHDIFEVFATEKKKRGNKAGKASELSATPPTTQAQPVTTAISATATPATSSTPNDTQTPAANFNAPRTNTQYRYQSNAEDQQLVSELEEYLMQGKLSLTTPAHVFAASPAIRKILSEKLKVRKVETNEYEAVLAEDPDRRRTTTREDTFDLLPHHRSPNIRPPAFCLPLQEIDVLVNTSLKVAAILDTGSQITVIRQDIVQALGVRVNYHRLIEMEGANGATNWTVGCAENLTIQVGDVSLKIHAHVVECASFALLLGRPFQQTALCRFEDLPSGDVEVSVRDPANTARRVYLVTRPRTGRATSVNMISTRPVPSALYTAELPAMPNPFLPLPPIDPTTLVLKYKKVDKKVRPVPTTLPEEFRTIRRIPEDPLLSLPPLPTHPPDFTPGERLTQERLNELDLNPDNFLWPEELKLVHHTLKLNEQALAWTEAEKGRFRDEYFSPVKIPVIEHIPWAHKNLPIPPGILEDVIKIFREKLAAGVYEHSDASYRSRWFCVKKKSGALRLVHDLQPLNAVTIRNSGVPPIPDQVIEAMAGRSCYTILDLLVGYDHRTLDIASRDLTTVQSPVGTVRLTCLPQGWTGAVPIFHGDVTFILEPEIPDPAQPFVDDTGIKGPPTRYETKDGGYETIPANPQIRRFIWEHLNDVHRILHRFRCAGATVSAKKIAIAVPEVTLLGHKCNYEGRIPDDSKIAKIRDWPACKSLADVRAFLGITGYMRIWIKNYSAIARPLVNLTRKGAPFVWQEEHKQAMQELKNAIVQSPALISIDYTTDRAVYLSVDSSVRGVGWILAQDCADGRRRPSRFGSISWNERESRYSQAKLELYGLFRALRAMRLYLVSVRNLIVEVDASYIKGMISNPDIQPNAAINRWIAAILLFDFKLAHVPADKHKGPDGLSRREPVPGEDEEDDPEDWVDNALALGTWVVSWLNAFPPNMCHTGALVLAIEPSTDDDEDSAPLDRPRRDRRLPARYRTGDFLPSDPTRAHGRPRSSPSKLLQPPPQPNDYNNNNNDYNNNTNTNLDNNTNTENNINTYIPDTDAPDTPQLPDPDINAYPLPECPTSDKHTKADAEMELIRQYLLSRRAPPDLPPDALTRFINRASRFLIAQGRLWRRQHNGRHQLYAPSPTRLALVRDAHDNLGHKGFYSTRRTLLDRFWWPALETDVKWYVQTCHQCQIRQTTKVHLPPMVDTPAPLFRKVYIDTMFMPPAGGFRYIVQARCSLTAWPEWRALRTETGRTIGSFIFEEILCRWGAVEEIVTDNGTAYVAALDWLADKFGIRHIRISAYNSQANGIVERQHRTIRDSIFKACDGDDSRWPTVAPFAFWADRATTRQSTGHSPFYMAHGVEPILPFDLVQATFLVPDLIKPLSTTELLATRARQLQKRQADLASIRDRISASRHASARQFEKHYANTIHDYDFTPGALVLVRNSSLTMDKMKPRYLGPMVVLRRTRNGAYRLGELDGTVSRLRYAAFRLIPYHARSRAFIPVTHVVDGDDFPPPSIDDTSERGAGDLCDESTQEGRNLNPPGGVTMESAVASETSPAAHAAYL